MTLQYLVNLRSPVTKLSMDPQTGADFWPEGRKGISKGFSQELVRNPKRNTLFLFFSLTI